MTLGVLFIEPTPTALSRSDLLNMLERRGGFGGPSGPITGPVINGYSWSIGQHDRLHNWRMFHDWLTRAGLMDHALLRAAQPVQTPCPQPDEMFRYILCHQVQELSEKIGLGIECYFRA